MDSKKLKMSLPATYVEGFHDPEVVAKMKYRPLGGTTGVDVSILSYGASALGSVYRETVESESIEVVRTAIKSGINLIDTAPWYGHGKSETVVGKALKGIPRSAYYLNTKCGRYNPDALEMFDFRAERVIASVDESLERLGVDYIDSIQIHDPEFAPDLDIIINETLPALQKCREAGKVKWIGMTGYPLDMQKYVIENSPVKIDTSLVYCHYSLNDTTLVDYLPFFKEKEIGVIGASPVSMGLLTNRGPPKWHPATEEIKKACADAATYCESKGVDISRIAMTFSISNEDIPTTLVSTANVQRLKSNIEAVNYTLNDTEQAALDHIMKEYFEPLKGHECWVDLEVDKYWKKVGKAALKKYFYNMG